MGIRQESCSCGGVEEMAMAAILPPSGGVETTRLENLRVPIQFSTYVAGQRRVRGLLVGDERQHGGECGGHPARLHGVEEKVHGWGVDHHSEDHFALANSGLVGDGEASGAEERFNPVEAALGGGFRGLDGQPVVHKVRRVDAFREEPAFDFS
jgi:hypothetical protein